MNTRDKQESTEWETYKRAIRTTDETKWAIAVKRDVNSAFMVQYQADQHAITRRARQFKDWMK